MPHDGIYSQLNLLLDILLSASTALQHFQLSTISSIEAKSIKNVFQNDSGYYNKEIFRVMINEC